MFVVPGSLAQHHGDPAGGGRHLDLDHRNTQEVRQLCKHSNVTPTPCANVHPCRIVNIGIAPLLRPLFAQININFCR